MLDLSLDIRLNYKANLMFALTKLIIIIIIITAVVIIVISSGSLKFDLLS